MCVCNGFSFLRLLNKDNYSFDPRKIQVKGLKGKVTTYYINKKGSVSNNAATPEATVCPVSNPLDSSLVEEEEEQTESNAVNGEAAVNPCTPTDGTDSTVEDGKGKEESEEKEQLGVAIGVGDGTAGTDKLAGEQLRKDLDDDLSNSLESGVRGNRRRKKCVVC